MTQHIIRLTVLAVAFTLLSATWVATPARTQQADRAVQNTVAGQSVTRLTDGTWLVIGGMTQDGPRNEIAIVETGRNATPAHAWRHHWRTRVDGTRPRCWPMGRC
jgi:hypothetical protein